MYLCQQNFLKKKKTLADFSFKTDKICLILICQMFWQNGTKSVLSKLMENVFVFFSSSMHQATTIMQWNQSKYGNTAYINIELTQEWFWQKLFNSFFTPLHCCTVVLFFISRFFLSHKKFMVLIFSLQNFQKQ